MMLAKKMLNPGISLLIALGAFCLCISCGEKKGPDVSGIALSAPIGRFDEYFFNRFDTTNIVSGIAKMQSAYPHFTNDFVTNILGLRLPESPRDSVPMLTQTELKRFLKLTRPLYDSIAPHFKKTGEIQQQIEDGFRHVKYYYPSYPLPQVLMYLGPFNAPGVVITNESLAIGLQLFAGKNFSFYTSETGLQMFPAYISRTFEPEYIPANCMKVIVGDISNNARAGATLIDEMIEKGKEWYLLDKFLPSAPDSLKTGFTQSQLDFCESNEGTIWNFILQTNDLYTNEPSIIENFIGEAPTTEGMPSSSPGNIGQWVGYRIVQQYAGKNSSLTPPEIMKTPAAKIFAEAKYKPK